MMVVFVDSSLLFFCLIFASIVCRRVGEYARQPKKGLRLWGEICYSEIGLDR